jgi:putative ATP-dependent endonuclease of the OLD family
VRCNSLARVGLTPAESRAVRRMMDVTRASMYFAKGLILVEGVCEALLLPALAARCGYDLADRHVAVIPICGVAFDTFKKLLGPAAFGVRTAIITDADPPIARPDGGTWRDEVPEQGGPHFKLSDRTAKLLKTFDGHETVRVTHAKLTLEYDLAEAGDPNAGYMADAWARCFERAPGTLTRVMVDAPGLSRAEKALLVWRGVCRASSTGSKADLAQHLADLLDDPAGCPDFEVPGYIREAIAHVMPPVLAPETGPYAHVLADARA